MLLEARHQALLPCSFSPFMYLIFAFILQSDAGEGEGPEDREGTGWSCRIGTRGEQALGQTGSVEGGGAVSPTATPPVSPASYVRAAISSNARRSCSGPRALGDIYGAITAPRARSSSH
jgi:hypothetical protein